MALFADRPNAVVQLTSADLFTAAEADNVFWSCAVFRSRKRLYKASTKCTVTVSSRIRGFNWSVKEDTIHTLEVQLPLTDLHAGDSAGIVHTPRSQLTVNQ